ncbi:MAG TPA: hypothetical protein VMC83_32700 [Streptosporangiaceae bacterium]|nr:hypothetical protein [Streptosporangiaceae bacterium]
MKFLRQFGAVVAVVAVVVLLGLAWNRLAPSLPGEGPSGEVAVVQGSMVKAPPHGPKAAPGRTAVFKGKRPPGAAGVRVNGGGTPGLDLGGLLEPVNLAVLRYNAELEAVIIAAVVIASASYRDLRRRWRARTRVSPPADTDLS